MSKDLNEQQQISASFSSPEFSASQQQQQLEDDNYTSGVESSPVSSSAAAASGGGVTTTTTKMVKSSTGGITTSSTTTTTTTSRAINTTRDSGFGDSIAEDTSHSSASARQHLGAHTEHGFETSGPDNSNIVLTTKCFPGDKSKLKSVEEDIDVIHPVEGIKSLIF